MGNGNVIKQPQKLRFGRGRRSKRNACLQSDRSFVLSVQAKPKSHERWSAERYIVPAASEDFTRRLAHGQTLNGKCGRGYRPSAPQLGEGLGDLFCPIIIVQSNASLARGPRSST